MAPENMWFHNSPHVSYLFFNNKYINTKKGIKSLNLPVSYLEKGFFLLMFIIPQFSLVLKNICSISYTSM